MLHHRVIPGIRMTTTTDSCNNTMTISFNGELDPLRARRLLLVLRAMDGVQDALYLDDEGTQPEFRVLRVVHASFPLCLLAQVTAEHAVSFLQEDLRDELPGQVTVETEELSSGRVHFTLDHRLRYPEFLRTLRDSLTELGGNGDDIDFIPYGYVVCLQTTPRGWTLGTAHRWFMELVNVFFGYRHPTQDFPQVEPPATRPLFAATPPCATH